MQETFISQTTYVEYYVTTTPIAEKQDSFSAEKEDEKKLFPPSQIVDNFVSLYDSASLARPIYVAKHFYVRTLTKVVHIASKPWQDMAS